MLRDRVAFLLGKLGREAAERYTTQLEPLGVRPTHCSILDAISSGENMSQLDVGRALGQAPSGLVTLLDDLEHMGAITRIRDESDRRRHVLALTPTGQRLLAQADALARSLDADLLRSLGPDDSALFTGLLRRVAQGLAIISAEPSVVSE